MAKLSAPIAVTVGGELVYLLASRAMYWPRGQCVVVADVHLGKAASFRSLGVPVPGGSTASTLARLDEAIAQARALGGVTRLLVLGDLIHGPRTLSASAWQAFLIWRQANDDLRLEIVQGNHDAKSGLPWQELQAERLEQGHREGPFAWCHEPSKAGQTMAGFAWAGHVHPVVWLSGKARDRLRLPSFVVNQNEALLPAFGEFTGGHVVDSKDWECIYALVSGSQPGIIQVKPQKTPIRQPRLA